MRRAAELRLLERTGALFAQLFFIAAGVYLGNQADDWKQERAHREAARVTLQNFRTELAANRDLLVRPRRVLAAYADSMTTSERRGDPAPKSVRDALERLGWQGTVPVTFNHTAWDLAMGTQSLSYLPPSLAFKIARVYNFQEHIHDSQRAASAALFNPAGMSDAQIYPWLLALGGYVGDMSYAMPDMARMYDDILPRLDSALARAPR